MGYGLENMCATAVKVFLWLTLHNIILCNANRVTRKMATDPSCQRCGHPEEALLHIFRDCTIVRHIWQTVGGTANYPSFFTNNLTTWLQKNLKADGLIYAEKWPTCFATTLWWMWKWRNCVVFGRDREIPIDVRAFLHTRIEETWRSLKWAEEEDSNGRTTRKEVLIKWLAPPIGHFTLNTDGASKGTPGEAGGGHYKKYVF